LQEFHLDVVKEKLKGPTEAQIISYNQWAATALDKFHTDSTAVVHFDIEGEISEVRLNWDSGFSKAAMREKKDMANFGGVAMAFFVMSVLKDYSYVEQTEIGDGVDYRFKMQEPSDDDLNFLNDYHFVEISGILEESQTNTLSRRIKEKHSQIDSGEKHNEASSVIVTLFNQPKIVKEIHR
jgi:hypothetical protein